MNDFIGQYQYAIAWAVYLASGIVFCAFWFRITRGISHSGWQDLLRGITLVAMFTPWFTSETHEHYAPAIIVVLMDLLLGSTENGLAGSMVLLIASAMMLGVLIVRRLLANKGS